MAFCAHAAAGASANNSASASRFISCFPLCYRCAIREGLAPTTVASRNVIFLIVVDRKVVDRRHRRIIRGESCLFLPVHLFRLFVERDHLERRPPNDVWSAIANNRAGLFELLWLGEGIGGNDRCG